MNRRSKPIDVAWEDLDAVGELEQSLKTRVELAGPVDGLDRQVRPGGVADEERVAREDEPRLFGPGPVDDCKATVLGAVAGSVDHPEGDVAQHHLLPVLERIVLVSGLRRRMDRDRDSMRQRQTPVSRDVVGVRVRLERARDLHALLLGRCEVLLDRVGGIDDNRLLRLLIADEIRRAAEIVVDELPEDHGFDGNTGGGLFS